MHQINLEAFINLPTTKRKPISKYKLKESLIALGFVSPLFIGFIIFTLIPLFVAIAYSLVDYMPLRGTVKPISLDVYRSLFQTDTINADLKQSIINTLLLMISIPLNIFLGLIISGLITMRGLKFKTLYRVILYLPAVTGAVAIAFVWKLIFNETHGLANIVLKNLGIINKNINWLGISDGYAYPRFVIIMKNVWGGLGGVVILYVAGILSIPRTLYEAAEIDGASKARQFFSITVPLLSPITFYLFIVSIIGGLQSFMDTQLIANTNATQTIVYFIYNHGINNYRYGFASAASVLLAIVVMVITVGQFKVQDKIGQKTI